MNVACGACPAKYVIPDDKVKGRKVRIACKHCGAAIIVDGTAPASGAANLPSKAPSAVPSVPSNRPQSAIGAPAPKAPPPAQPVAEAPKPLPEIPKPTAEAPKPVARPAQRNIRQTIIGVALPANAPESPGAQPVRRPTPIYVRAANADPLPPPTPEVQTSARASGQVRSIRRTMLGGLDGDAPTSETSNPEAAAPVRPKKRDIKQTIIGGLEPPKGSAPGATEAPKRPRPMQETPPGTWLAALPDGKTLKIAERDLPRAVKKAYISMATPLWHSRLGDWVPLEQIPELLSLLNKSATLPQASNQDATESEARRLPLPLGAPPQAHSKAPDPRAASTSTSRQPAVSRASAAPAGSAKMPSFSPQKPEDVGFSAAKPQVSRSPGSVSARSSSPTLELVEIQDEDEIAGIVAAEEESAAPTVDGLRDLARLATAKPRRLEPKAVSTPPSPKPKPSVPATYRPAQSFAPAPAIQTYGAPDGAPRFAPGASTVATSSIPLSMGSRVTLPVSRHRKRRALIVTLVSLLIVAALIASYITRQPSALFGYLRAHGWEQALDQAVQPLTSRVKKLIHR